MSKPSVKVNLEKRLQLLGFGDADRDAIAKFRPHILGTIDAMIARFYKHMLLIPEARAILSAFDVDGRLKPLQRQHWEKLFSCTFDQDYLQGAMRVGRRHYEARVPPYIYLAGYSFVHCELIEIARETMTESGDLGQVLVALARLISLDTDLAMSGYTREVWLGKT